MNNESGDRSPLIVAELRAWTSESGQDSFRSKASVDHSCRIALPKPAAANLSWPMDFVADGLADGRRFR